MNKIKMICLIITLLIVTLMGTTYAQDDIPTVGILTFNPYAFIEEMTNLGYIEGENINYMLLSFGDDPTLWVEEQETQTQAMIDASVDIFVVQTDSAAVALQETAGDIPMVFIIADDPITTGAVADLTTPGGTITGVVSDQHHPRRLQLLTEIDPDIKKVYYFYFPLTLEGEVIFEEVRDLGVELGVEVIGAPITSTEEGLQALEDMPEDVDWLFMTPYLFFDPIFDETLLEVSTTYNAPIAGFIVMPTPGYLINYGPDLDITAGQSAQIVDRILRGANPADLPIVIAENGLIVNLEAAETLGMEIPVAILRQADMIVRPGDFENMDLGFGSGD